MKKIYKHITIHDEDEVEHNGKPAFGVFNTKHGELIGVIEYFNDWKQYIFSGIEESVFSVSCLQDIIDFIENEIK